VNRSPPPFFKQGPSANARLVFFSLFAIVLLVIDSRMDVLERIRQAVATVIYPVQRVLLVPRDLLGTGRQYIGDIGSLREENADLRHRATANAWTLQQNEKLSTENRQLRRLLAMHDRAVPRSTVAEVLYDTRDAFSRRLVLDKGSQQGVAAGQPVIDPEGVVGQVTRVYPLSSEVTLMTDHASTIPVELRRTGERSLAYGGSMTGTVELRYLRSTADVRAGDEIVTSGLDGVFPAGLPVGVIRSVDSAGSPFIRAIIEPAARVERAHLLLVLLVAQTPPPDSGPPPDNAPEGPPAENPG
jgi:rod shape-determining protein MreC